jgi:hypothetical protein
VKDGIVVGIFVAWATYIVANTQQAFAIPIVIMDLAFVRNKIIFKTDVIYSDIL